MKQLILPVFAAAVLFSGAACSSNKTSDSAAATAGDNALRPVATAAGHAGGHTYFCSMHAEVVSDQPGECPKCGMTLEHTDRPAGNGKTYLMDLATTPAQPVAGHATLLSFRPQEFGNAQLPVPLQVVHEKKIHLIIVSKDLSEFYHEHPEFNASGRYEWSFTFPHGGEYVLFQDYTPAGAGHQLSRQVLTPTGPRKAPVKFAADRMQWAQDGYAATLAIDQPLTTGQLLRLKVDISRNGQPVTNLDNYLGALGHMVVISENTEEYLHVHPNDQTDQGPTVQFNTRFEMPGLYRVFLQFNHQGRVRTGDFTINVAPAAT